MSRESVTWKSKLLGIHDWASRLRLNSGLVSVLVPLAMRVRALCLYAAQVSSASGDVEVTEGERHERQSAHEATPAWVLLVNRASDS